MSHKFRNAEGGKSAPDQSVGRPREYARQDSRWLELKGRTWYAVQAVPRGLWAALGRRKFTKSLQTHDFHVAVSRRHAALAEFQRAIAGAGKQKTADDVLTAALSWRETFAAFERGDYSGFHTGKPDGQPGEGDEADKQTVAGWVLADEAEAVGADHGEAVARAFVGIATGTATPLLLHLDAWLLEGGPKGPLNRRTQDQYRSDVTAFAAWATAAGTATVEAVAPAVAGRFVTEELVGKGIHWATANRKITAASSYWRWLRKRAGVAGNPWVGQGVAKAGKRAREAPKRPFTADEVRALLAGPDDPELADAMRTAALSGMRLEEIYRLTVEDCAGGWFALRRAKTAAGVRRLPIHSGLAAIVEQRCAGKVSEAFLFHEAGDAKPGRERSARFSQRFGRYRQSVGVHERVEGARHARIDFHSWRRWFVTSARNAGIDRAVVAAVVGHETGNLTDDVYHGGPSEALLRACVEAVRLPLVG